MAEYIEREKAEIIFRDAHLALKPEGCKDWNEYITRDMMLMNAEQAIHIIPSADVLPVRHGRWIFKADSSWRGGGKYECSACKYGYAIGAYHEPDEFTYCPHCGAYMKDGGKE